MLEKNYYKTLIKNYCKNY